MTNFLKPMLATFIFVCATACSNPASESDHTMTGQYLSDLIVRIDASAEVSGNSVGFSVAERDVFLVYDEAADRMRVLTPVAPVGDFPPETYPRLLQANYDAVLDARYAMANDIVWSVFIHPLSSLTEDDFLSAVAQVVTAAETFGTSYTSGALIFGGGDSQAIHDDLLKALEEAAKNEAGRGI